MSKLRTPWPQWALKTSSYFLGLGLLSLFWFLLGSLQNFLAANLYLLLNLTQILSYGGLSLGLAALVGCFWRRDARGLWLLLTLPLAALLYLASSALLMLLTSGGNRP